MVALLLPGLLCAFVQDPLAVAVRVNNPSPVARTACVTAALPFAPGELRAGELANVRVDVADHAPVAARIAFRWPDGTVGLLHAEVPVTVPPFGETVRHLTPARDDAGAVAWAAAGVHRCLLPEPLPLVFELLDPWERRFVTTLERDVAAAPDGVLWQTGPVRVLQLRGRLRDGGGAPLLPIRAWLRTVDGSRAATLTLLLDNSDGAFGAVRLGGFAVRSTTPDLRFLPAFAAENGMLPPAPAEVGHRQWLLRPGLHHYLGDGTAKAFRIHLFQDGADGEGLDDAAREAARYEAQPLLAVPDLERTRATGSFGAHGGPAPLAEPAGAGDAGAQYLAWRQQARFGPYAGFGDPEDAAVQGSARNGPCVLHNLLRWRSPHLAYAADGMVLQHPLRPTPGRNPARPIDTAAWRQGLGPLAQTVPHGFTRLDYEHFAVGLLYDWWWLGGDPLARAELRRMGTGLRATMTGVPFRTSRGEGWGLQSGVLIARATGDVALREWLRRRAVEVTAELRRGAAPGIAIAQPSHPAGPDGDPFDGPWQIAALCHGLHAVWRATGDPEVAAALRAAADAIAGSGWLPGQGPKYLVSAVDPGRYTVPADPMTVQGVNRMVAAGLVLALDVPAAGPDADAAVRRALGFLCDGILPPDADPRRRAAALGNPWLQVVWDRRERGR